MYLVEALWIPSLSQQGVWVSFGHLNYKNHPLGVGYLIYWFLDPPIKVE